jgi:hypothetical protein
MTGPGHYKKAEQLAQQAHYQEPEQAAYSLRLAQVHATLALAAATALYLHSDDGWLQTHEQAAWNEVAGVKPAAAPETTEEPTR